jgi:gluconolactonase
MADRTIVRLEKDGSRTVLADRYEGKRFSGPNDVVVKSDGAIYFTDTINSLRGGANGPLRELPFNGFYLVKDGKVTLLDSDQRTLGGSPQRHHSLARRKVSLRHRRLRKNDAL